MYKLCTTERAAQQQNIMEAAFLRLLNKHHYDDITITDICREANLSRKVFYRLYEKKSDVLYSLIDHKLMEASTYQPDASVGPGELHRFLAYWKEQKDVLYALSANKVNSLLAERAIQFILREDSDLQHCFGTDEMPYGREAMRFYITGVFALVLAWHSNGFDKSIDELSRILMHLLTTPPVKRPLY